MMNRGGEYQAEELNQLTMQQGIDHYSTSAHWLCCICLCSHEFAPLLGHYDALLTRSSVVQRVRARRHDALVVVVIGACSAAATGGLLLTALAPGACGGSVERSRAATTFGLGHSVMHGQRGRRRQPPVSVTVRTPTQHLPGGRAVDGEPQHDNGEAQGGGACPPPPPHGRRGVSW